MPAIFLTWSYRVATLLIIGGFAMPCQPYWMSLFALGFPVLMIGVVLFMILDHIPSRRSD